MHHLLCCRQKYGKSLLNRVEADTSGETQKVRTCGIYDWKCPLSSGYCCTFAPEFCSEALWNEAKSRWKMVEEWQSGMSQGRSFEYDSLWHVSFQNPVTLEGVSAFWAQRAAVA